VTGGSEKLCFWAYLCLEFRCAIRGKQLWNVLPFISANQAHNFWFLGGDILNFVLRVIVHSRRWLLLSTVKQRGLRTNVCTAFMQMPALPSCGFFCRPRACASPPLCEFGVYPPLRFYNKFCLCASTVRMVLSGAYFGVRAGSCSSHCGLFTPSLPQR
jgi:hypothetical protein